jgi:hypothetical protein
VSAGTAATVPGLVATDRPVAIAGTPEGLPLLEFSRFIGDLFAFRYETSDMAGVSTIIAAHKKIAEAQTLTKNALELMQQHDLMDSRTKNDDASNRIMAVLSQSDRGGPLDKDAMETAQFLYIIETVFGHSFDQLPLEKVSRFECTLATSWLFLQCIRGDTK